MKRILVAMAMVLGLSAAAHAEESASLDLIRAANAAMECVVANRGNASVCQFPIVEVMRLELIALGSMGFCVTDDSIDDCEAYRNVEFGMPSILASALVSGVCVDLVGSTNDGIEDCAKAAARLVIISGAFD